MTILLAAVYTYDAYMNHRHDWWIVLYFVGWGVTFLMGRRVSFYENGIYFPQDPSGGRARFIAWRDLERFHWDGDLLTVVPPSSLLAGGGGDVGMPVLGGSVHVPAAKRVEVENLLAVASSSKI